MLFPQPLHIIRRVDDSVSKTSTLVHEYCVGNQVVTVSGGRVAIADYARQQLTEIDRDAGTYSVTRFDELAAASPSVPLRRQNNGTGNVERFRTTSLGVKRSRSGRSVDGYRVDINASSDKMAVEVGLDRGIRVSREALEVMLGAAYPSHRRVEHEAILRVAQNDRTRPIAAQSVSARAEEDHALPIEQKLTFEAGGETVTLESSIVELRHELPPHEVQAIPPGARRTESRAVRVARELRELDRLPSEQR